MNSLENLLPIDISGNFNFNDYLNRGANGDHVLWVPIAIFLCILAIWVICKFVRKLHKNYWYDSDNLLQGGMMIGNAVLVVVTNLLIMVYVLSTGPAALWFMYPGEDGNWTRTVIFGIVYLYCIINLLVGFLKTMDDFCGEIDGRINCKWGLGTLAIGLILLVICAMSHPNYISSVLIVLAICQLIQIVIIIYKSMGKGVITTLAAFHFITGYSCYTSFSLNIWCQENARRYKYT